MRATAWETFSAVGMSAPGITTAAPAFGTVSGPARDVALVQCLRRPTPMLDRAFHARRNQPEAYRIVVLNHGKSQRLFGGDPAIVEKTFS
jgi:hypothetical protein